ncbi:MAG: hypothetical protein ACREV1_07395, partial [Gammaproteobacteria bacterium]
MIYLNNSVTTGWWHDRCRSFDVCVATRFDAATLLNHQADWRTRLMKNTTTIVHSALAGALALGML